MAGLKYERFIVKMSIEQKIQLITSTEFFKSSSVGSYEFPVFGIENRPYDNCDRGVRVTHFPSDLALASSWNPALVNEVYAAIGAETCAQNSFGYFNCSGDISVDKLTSEYFVLGKFLAEKTAGLRRGNAFVNFEDAESEDETENVLMQSVRDEVLATAAPTSVIFNDVEEAEKTVKRFKSDSLTYGVASTVEEALDFLYTGASFLFLTSDFRNGLANRLLTLTNSYKIAHNKYVNDRMAESSFARLVRTFKVFDPEIIDRACDRIIDVVYTMKNNAENTAEEFKALQAGESSRFDEINHADLAVGAARQSIILIKNENAVLPISRAQKIAVIGEYAKEEKYQRSYFSTSPTVARLPFEVIDDYELNTVGFALGYSKGERGRTDLLDHATLLAGQADVVLLYLAAEKGAGALPPEQLDLLNAISGRGAKIIAIVEAADSIDMSFADKCSAVLLSYACGQGGAAAALDIITGDDCPSGKLTKAIGRMSGGVFVEEYGVGYGLSYTTFEYGNLKASESGVSFTVRNVGEHDGCAVPQLFVQKKNTQSVFKDKQLKGFTKVFVAAGDAVRVRIEFDDVTFSQYTKDKGYFIEGGLYTVSVGEAATDDKLSGIIMLKDYSEKNSFKNRVIDTSDDGRAIDFSESGLPADAQKARKSLPFGLKLALAIMFAVYVDAVLLLFILGDLISQKGMAFYTVIAVVGVAVNVLAVVYVVLSATRRKAQQYLHPNTLLTDMLDNVDDFAEIAKVKYRLPVEEEQTEEEAAEEQTETETETAAEELAATYEVKFDDSPVAEAVVAEKVSFSEIARNLHDFAMTRGLNIEMTSARVLVAAMASCKIVFITSKNTEMVPALVKVLGEYYGNDGVIAADDEWHSLSDILWSKSEDEDKFVLSAFSNAVYGAHKAHDQQRVVIIDNVNINNLGGYFCNFLEYANHPTEEFIISFNEDTSFRLPDNLTYVLVPQNGSMEGLPAEILNASMIADVMLTEVEAPATEGIEPKVISHEDFRLMLSECKETCFVGERIWKKVDALAETLCAGEKFEIGNKNTIQMESFTSVMIECGADEPEAVTNMFLVKLAYILKNTRTYRTDGGEKTVYSIIEKLFPDEELIKIKRVLTKSAQTAATATVETKSAETEEATEATEETAAEEQPAEQPAEQAQAAAKPEGQPAEQPAQPAEQPASADTQAEPADDTNTEPKE